MSTTNRLPERVPSIVSPVSHAWALRDFDVIDKAGNRLRFGQTFE